MAFRSFQDFVEQLDRAGQLQRIQEPVDTDLVIAEWANREMKSPGGGKALLFEKPIINGKASAFPVAINTMGSRRRIAMALGVNDVADLAQEIQLILKAKPPTDLREGFALLRQGIHLLHARPKHVKEGACQEVVDLFDQPSTTNHQLSLGDLPILKCWPKDGGRFITFPNVHTRDPESGARNVGMYRMQIFDERTTAMHWQVHKVGARHGKVYYQRGERMPVAVTLGGFCCNRTIAGRTRRNLVCWIFAQEIGGAGEMQNNRRGRSRRCRFRFGGFCPTRRNATRRAIRRSHRFLYRGRGLSGLSSNRNHASE